jgi:hypothetical protein
MQRSKVTVAIYLDPTITNFLTDALYRQLADLQNAFPFEQAFSRQLPRGQATPVRKFNDAVDFSFLPRRNPDIRKQMAVS